MSAAERKKKDVMAGAMYHITQSACCLPVAHVYRDRLV